MAAQPRGLQYVTGQPTADMDVGWQEPPPPPPPPPPAEEHREHGAKSQADSPLVVRQLKNGKTDEEPLGCQLFLDNAPELMPDDAQIPAQAKAPDSGSLVRMMVESTFDW